MSKNAQATAKKIATNLAKRLPNSHSDVLEALQKTQFIAMNKGLNPETFVLVHEGKTIQDGYTFTTTVETTNEKISNITTEAVKNNETVAKVVYHNTADGDGACNWVKQ